jgi:hypothetical protein
MWERADGIRTPTCADSDHPIKASGRGPLRLGRGWLPLLRKAGQPQQRTRAWTWCVTGELNHNAADVAELSRAGVVELVGSTARGRTAGGIRVGAPARRLAGAQSAGGGVLYRGAWVYAVRGGRVRAVGVASRSLARSPKALRSAMRRVLTAKATTRARVFIPNPAQAGKRGRITGRTLAGTSDPKLNAALAMLCSLQVSGAAAR